MDIRNTWDFINSFQNFDEATKFFYKNKNFGSEMKLPKELGFRNCITAMLIYKFPQEVLDNNQWDNYLEITSKQLIDGLLSNETEERKNLRVKAFLHIFNLWKKQDKEGLLKHLSSMYLMSRNTLFLISQNMDVLPPEEQENKQEEIKELTIYMEKIKKSIETFDKEYLKKFLENQKEPEEIKEDMMKQISQSMYKTFWKWLLECLEKGDYEPAFKNLQEAIEGLDKLGKLEFDFDLDYYKHLVQQKLFTHEDLFKIGMYMVEECKKRGAPEDDKFSDEQFNAWKIRVETKEETIPKLFIDILQLIVELLGRIKYRVFVLTQKVV